MARLVADAKHGHVHSPHFDMDLTLASLVAHVLRVGAASTLSLFFDVVVYSC
jgi:hypothetical protein